MKRQRKTFNNKLRKLGKEIIVGVIFRTTSPKNKKKGKKNIRKYEAIKQTINEVKGVASSPGNAIKAKSNLGDKCENVSNDRIKDAPPEKGAWLQLTQSSLPASRQSIKRNNISRTRSGRSEWWRGKCGCASRKTVDKMATTVGTAI